ncbi:hypothetical protein BDP27DRAFT_1431425 [Rhodocollybia butyracea]|uniref:Uncharacterized protein n=1 Tax=Rhodocollybia butyracea TaxID=206335 RepID=A0A9P5TZE2_9AGAR|nr:hypothetical protein BDP27DRAFT_1431425 [Rhodocollybia butyracea]
MNTGIAVDSIGADDRIKLWAPSLTIDATILDTIVDVTQPSSLRLSTQASATTKPVAANNPELPCALRPHIWISTEYQDCYNNLQTGKWEFCNRKICLNRYNIPSPTTDIPEPAKRIDKSQEKAVAPKPAAPVLPPQQPAPAPKPVAPLSPPQQPAQKISRASSQASQQAQPKPQPPPPPPAPSPVPLPAPSPVPSDQNTPLIPTSDLPHSSPPSDGEDPGSSDKEESDNGSSDNKMSKS